jgi:threonine synthase
MSFIETRGNDGIKPNEVEFSYAILNPMASYGGLYVPKELPQLGLDFIKEHIN